VEKVNLHQQFLLAGRRVDAVDIIACLLLDCTSGGARDGGLLAGSMRDAMPVTAV
jgi:hypothetical protein